MATLEENKSLYETKKQELNEAIENGDLEKAQELMVEVKELKAQIDGAELQREETTNENEERSVEQTTTVEETPEETVVTETKEDVLEETTTEKPLEENNETTVPTDEVEADENKKQIENKGDKRSMTNVVEEVVMNNGNEKRDAFLHYIQTGEKRAGLTTESGAIIVPTEVATEVLDYTDDVTALANLVQIKNVKNGQGEIAFFDGASVDPLTAVPELEQNPLLGIKPIQKKSFKVETYRGYYPVSKESIEDGIGALELVRSLLSEAVVATQNKLVLDILNAKTATAVTTADQLKKVLNIDLAPKHKKQIVLSQTAYNWVDTLKDGNGRYLFQDSITSQSGKQLFGLPVTVVEDNTIGAENMYVGDLSSAVGLVNRSRYDAQWTSYMQFAECLMVAVRLDAVELNPNAVVKLTVPATL